MQQWKMQQLIKGTVNKQYLKLASVKLGGSGFTNSQPSLCQSLIKGDYPQHFFDAKILRRTGPETDWTVSGLRLLSSKKLERAA